MKNKHTTIASLASFFPLSLFAIWAMLRLHYLLIHYLIIFISICWSLEWMVCFMFVDKILPLKLDGDIQFMYSNTILCTESHFSSLGSLVTVCVLYCAQNIPADSDILKEHFESYVTNKVSISHKICPLWFYSFWNVKA
jgi:hypothetical protein